MGLDTPVVLVVNDGYYGNSSNGTTIHPSYNNVLNYFNKSADRLAPFIFGARALDQ
ncbi:hypothetical protein PIB30_068922 [Stylosanthes scabra]|uniref:Uncharacterized protein n=1 Tax=Stylosanthes scabra TaxID=79078 RepID=A0ABU6QNP4_9FABA|nr:hypothetical protein [Stylosanthes scabra]